MYMGECIFSIFQSLLKLSIRLPKLCHYLEHLERGHCLPFFLFFLARSHLCVLFVVREMHAQHVLDMFPETRFSKYLDLSKST